MPVGALRAMGRRDAFVSLQERRDASYGGFPARPRSFAASAATQAGSDLNVCLGASSRIDSYWLPFQDAGRGFYAIVAIGEDATDDARQQAFAILDSLRVTPAQR